MAALLSLFRHAARAAPVAADAELLARFADRRDEDAFAEIVRRHGPVVFRICNRLVGPAGAEDAFQAVFLVLATRLKAAQAAPSVGGWLVGVAGRVARQMRRAANRRSRHETAAAESRPTERAEQTSDLTDQFRALDEELARLPDHLRDPVVLCFLQGRTQAEAAAELGRDARTLRRRLDRAKHVLRARLERRGVVPAVAAALLAGAGQVSATVPPDLAPRTISTVFDFLTGGPAAAGSAPVALAKGVATTMLTRKLMSLTVAVAAGLIGLGAVLAADGPPTAAPKPLPPAPAPLTAAAPQPAKLAPPSATAAAPIMLPAAPAEDFDWKANEDKFRRLLGAMRRTAEPGQKTVVIEALCMKAPAGFCERCGLTDEDSAAGVWTLTPRECRMFTALIRAEKLQGGLDVLARPQLALDDGQTGRCEIGQPVEVVTGLEAVKKDGKIVYTATTGNVNVGMKLVVTPKVAANGYMQLKVETENSELVPAPTPAGGKAVTNAPVVQARATNKQVAQATLILPDAGTAVIRASLSAAPGGKPGPELLWVLTAHVVRGEKKPAAGEPAPAPPFAVPPARP